MPAIDLSGGTRRLALYESAAIVPIRTFAPGVYFQKIHSEGNSLLSTVFLQSRDLGASISVRYYDAGVGEDLGEQIELAVHNTLSTPLSSDRITVARLHNKPVVELTVTGGNVTAGVFLTVVASFVTDLDQALQLDASTVNLLSDKGMPAMLYDQTQNKFFFLRGEGGVLPVSFSEAGDPVHLASQALTTPNVTQDLITDTVPVGKTRKLNQAFVACRQSGSYTITLDGVIIGSGRTGPANPNSIFTWNPRVSALAGQELKISFLQISGTPVVDVEAYLMGSDI